MPINIDNILVLADNLNKQVVGYYDDVVHKLGSSLCRIIGFDYRNDDDRSYLNLYLQPLNSSSSFPIPASAVLTYEDIRFIHDSTKTVFLRMSEILNGCLLHSIFPLKQDLMTLENLLKQYDNLGLIIEEDSTCAITTE